MAFTASSRCRSPFSKGAKRFARRKGRSNAAFIFDIFRAKSRSDFSPEKGWSLKKGRGFRRQPLPFFTIQPRLMAPRLNACGVEVFSESAYSFKIAPLSCRARLWDAAALFRYWYYMQRIVLFYGALCNAHASTMLSTRPRLEQETENRVMRYFYDCSELAGIIDWKRNIDCDISSQPKWPILPLFLPSIFLLTMHMISLFYMHERLCHAHHN
jgi:hypothetical protein